MNVAKEEKKDRKYIKIIFIIIGLIIILLSVIYFFGYELYLERKYLMKVKFVSQYIPEKYAIHVIKYSDKYGIDFIDSLSLLFTESDGDRKCRGTSKEYGYYQILPETYRPIRDRLKKIIKSTDIYGELNIAGGNLHLKAMMSYCTNKLLKAVECYNLGIGKFRIGKKNSPYITKFLDNKTFFETEWKEFKIL
jgi:soluble lytic murein transglycosylase-like protein